MSLGLLFLVGVLLPLSSISAHQFPSDADSKTPVAARVAAGFEVLFPMYETVDELLEKHAPKARPLTRAQAAKDRAESNYYVEFLWQYVGDMDDCYLAQVKRNPKKPKGESSFHSKPDQIIEWPLGKSRPDKISPADIEKALGADDFQVREEASIFAERNLVAMTPALAATLKATESPEVRWRAQAILQDQKLGILKSCLQKAMERYATAIFKEIHPEKSFQGCGGRAK